MSVDPADLQYYVNLFTGVFTPAVALLAAILARSARQKIQQVHIEINSRMTEMLALVGRAERSEGHAQGYLEGLASARGAAVVADAAAAAAVLAATTAKAAAKVAQDAINKNAE